MDKEYFWFQSFRTNLRFIYIYIYIYIYMMKLRFMMNYFKFERFEFDLM